MKTIFIVSRKPDFTASRLMEEPALMSHGYICCGMYKVYDKVDSVCVDFSEARVWDESAVDAIDKIVVRYGKRKVKVKFKGLNKASAVLVLRMLVLRCT